MTLGLSRALGLMPLRYINYVIHEFYCDIIITLMFLFGCLIAMATDVSTTHYMYITVTISKSSDIGNNF